MRCTLQLALVALVAASGCDDPERSAFGERPIDAAPQVDAGADAEPEPAAEPAPEAPCTDDARCIDQLGPHGRCVGTPEGLPDPVAPANNVCVVAPRGLTVTFPEPEFTAPEAHALDMNLRIADAWRARGLQIVLRLDDHPAWHLQPDGSWLPEFSGLLYPSWDGVRVAPGVDPIPLATQAGACAGADACATLIFIDSLSAPMRLPSATEDACAPSPFVLFGSAGVQLQVDAAGQVVGARMDFGMILGWAAARDTPWADGALRDVLDAIDYRPTVDTNGDAEQDAWELGFFVEAGPDGIAASTGDAPVGDCLP